jgi:hypothetical protein
LFSVSQALQIKREKLTEDKLAQAMAMQVLYFVLFFVALCAAVLMLLQLWTSTEALSLENQDGIHFFQILNRYALSVDSENLFANGGMLLIKAITGSIVTHGRALVGESLPPIESRTPSTRAPPKAVEGSSTDSKFHFYYRGGSVPFEMVSAFFILISMDMPIVHPMF